MLLDCPKSLIAMSNRLRVEQIVGARASLWSKALSVSEPKLLTEWSRCMAHVEDSGLKRKRLFSKFQESLDSLDQGTGIGLSVCKTLVYLLRSESSIVEKNGVLLDSIDRETSGFFKDETSLT
jgi:hypothetical protein